MRRSRGAIPAELHEFSRQPRCESLDKPAVSDTRKKVSRQNPRRIGAFRRIAQNWPAWAMFVRGGPQARQRAAWGGPACGLPHIAQS